MGETAYSSRSIWADVDPTPEEKLFQSIIIQAFKDYITNPEEKKDVREWVVKQSGNFNFCATALGIGKRKLQQIMLRKLEEVDRTGEREFNYSRE